MLKATSNDSISRAIGDGENDEDSLLSCPSGDNSDEDSSARSRGQSSVPSSEQPASPPQNRRQSTLQWFCHKIAGHSHRQIVDNIERQHSSSRKLLQDDDAPVNILVCEGGGLKGQALVGMIRGLTEKNQGEDILQYFDLACGTSIGGITALTLNRKGTTQGLCKDAGDILSCTCERTFKRLSWRNLFQTGSLTNQDNDLATAYKEKCGDTPLYNPDGLKAFALTTLKVEENNQMKCEPFLLRTYDTPEDSNQTNDDNYHFKGTHDVKLWEAMTMTSAALGLADRVNFTINGQTQRFADGDVIANNPTAIAIMEARRLWPNRPIGVVVSLSLMNNERHLVLKAAEKAKELHPSMKFAYFWPPIEIHMALDTCPRKLQKAVDLAAGYILESQEAQGVIESLKASGSRWTTKRKQSFLASSASMKQQRRFTTWFRGSQLMPSSSFPSDSNWNEDVPDVTARDMSHSSEGNEED